MRITIDIPAEIYQRLEAFAQANGQPDVASLIDKRIKHMLAPFSGDTRRQEIIAKQAEIAQKQQELQVLANDPDIVVAVEEAVPTEPI